MSSCEVQRQLQATPQMKATMMKTPKIEDVRVEAIVEEEEEAIDENGSDEEEDEGLEEFNPYWRNQTPIMPIVLTGNNNHRPARTKSKGAKVKQPKKSQAEINGAYSLFARDQHDKSRINIYGERGMGMEFNATALPGHAKLIIKRSERFEKKHTNISALENSAEEQVEDEETVSTYIRKSTYGGSSSNKASLADFLSNDSSSALVAPQTNNNGPSPSAWTSSPWAVKTAATSQMSGVRNTLDCIDECLSEFSKTSSSSSSDSKEEQAQLLDALVSQCSELETSLLSLLETNADEQVVNEALSLLERISTTRDRYVQLR